MARSRLDRLPSFFHGEESNTGNCERKRKNAGDGVGEERTCHSRKNQKLIVIVSERHS